ncbi:hypothetical protein EVAR_88125_1 [Eumeta japonica]|uniref:Uncharacterized protein n=1 Tax=Eumeta variegata TaxID=151549 RepID=A0A4C1WPN4_EUMVA|nr:hypothetical protein EVAR_88125_1 [Eumeta japonica]
MKCFEIEYDSTEWRLFIDSSKTSLKAVLLHNGNVFASLPVAHSVHMKENYNDLAIILEKIKCQEHQWMHMLTAYSAQGCKMSLKVHFLHSHIEYFPENLGAYSEEQGEIFHQDVRDIERRYQGRWDVNSDAVLEFGSTYNPDLGTAPYSDSGHALDSNFSPSLNFELGPVLDFDSSLS